MNIDNTFGQAKETLEEIKKDPKNLKNLHWGWPLAGAILIALCKGLLLADIRISVAIVVVLLGIGIWTLVFKTQNKPNPLKLGWGYFIIPAGAIAAILIAPQVFVYIIVVLIIWAIGAAVYMYTRGAKNKEF